MTDVFVLQAITYEFLDQAALINVTIIEKAIELMSACLPVMAPFLHMHAVLSDVRAFFRSLLSSYKNVESEPTHDFHNLDLYNRTFAPGQNQHSICTATGTPGDSDSGPDMIPLRSSTHVRWYYNPRGRTKTAFFLGFIFGQFRSIFSW